MDEPLPSSPIIRSSWKPRNSEPILPNIIPVINTPTVENSFASGTTVSPLTGFRESATVTDISWTTAFQTPTKATDSNALKNRTQNEDVFEGNDPAQSCPVMEQSEMEISVPFNTSSLSLGMSPKPCPNSFSTTKVLSTFRNSSLLRKYPKNATPISKKYYSTPKPDRFGTAMPEPPTSAIIARTPATMNNLRQRICPCNCCTCPPVYVKDVAMQTSFSTSGGQDSTMDRKNSPELGDLTQLAAETVGKFDGLTQQTIMETAKPKRSRPKSVVQFKEPTEEREISSKSCSTLDVTPLNDFKDTLSVGVGFKSGRGKPVMVNKPVDVSKLFGNIMEGFPISALDDVCEIEKELVTSTNVNQEENDAIDQAIGKNNGARETKKPFGADFTNSREFNLYVDSGACKFTGSKIASGFTKAGTGDVITSSKKVDVKKLFGDDFATLDIYGSSIEKDSPGVKVNFKSTENIGFLTSASESKPCSGFSKAGSGTAILSSKNIDIKKLFGEDFGELRDKSGASIEVVAQEIKLKKSSTSTSSALGFTKAGTGAALECTKKVDLKKIFGDELENLEFPRKVADKQSESETTKIRDFQPVTRLPSVTPVEDDMSDVESIYDVDIDSSSLQETTDDNEPMEDSIPAEMFLPTAEAISSYDSKLVEARAQQRKIIADKNSSDSSERTYGVLYRSRLYTNKSKFLKLTSLHPKYQDVDLLDDNILRLLIDPYESYRFPAVFNNEQLICRWNTIDGGLLVSAADGTVGFDEISTCLLTTPGVDPRLIPNGWIANHFRWIVWKLAKEVFAFCDQFPKPEMRLKAEVVLQQLKYRYDREINCCNRSCIRRIVEKDSSPKGLMVLCVSKIIKHPSANESNSTMISEDDQQSKDSTSSNFHQHQQQIELTDGWYAVNASLDHHLQRMVNCGRIFVGCKLVVAGSELLGLSDGCDPLNIPASCCLRLSSNSTRLVTKWWEVKMGFLANSKLDVPISSLLPGGGFAHSIKVLIARVYPLLYVEKRVSNVTGMTESIYRLENEEAAEAERSKVLQEKKMEEVMQKMSEDNSQSPVKPGGKRRKITQSEVKEISSGDEIAEALRESFDPESLMEMLSKEQKMMYQQYLNLQNDRVAKKMRQAIEKMKEDHPNVIRNVVPMLKIFVVGVHANDKQHNSTAVISIWRPVANYRDLLQEGHVFHFHNVTVSRPASGANSAAMLNGTQHTSWEPVKTQIPFDDCYTERIVGLVKLINMTQKEAVYCNREMDMAGVILKVNSESRRLYFIDINGDVGVIVGNSVSFCSFLNGVERNVPVVFVAMNLKSISTGGSNISNTNLPSLLAQDFSFFTFLPPNTQSVPLRLTNLCRHLEASLKSAIANRNSLSETGFSKLQAIIKLNPLMEENADNMSFCSDIGPQRPGSSVGSGAKTPLSAILTGPELQKRKMERLDRFCTAVSQECSLLAPSPLPEDTKPNSAKMRNVLRRAFRPPSKMDSSMNNSSTNS